MNIHEKKLWVKLVIYNDYEYKEMHGQQNTHLILKVKESYR